MYSVTNEFMSFVSGPTRSYTHTLRQASNLVLRYCVVLIYNNHTKNVQLERASKDSR